MRGLCKTVLLAKILGFSKPSLIDNEAEAKMHGIILCVLPLSIHSRATDGEKTKMGRGSDSCRNQYPGEFLDFQLCWSARRRMLIQKGNHNSLGTVNKPCSALISVTLDSARSFGRIRMTAVVGFLVNQNPS